MNTQTLLSIVADQREESNTRYYTIFYPYSSVFDKKVDNKRECFIENYREVQIMF